MKNVFEYINNWYLDYRYKVHENAGICFAYYLIMSIFPICSLCAYFASLFNADLTLLMTILNKFLQPEYSTIVIDVLTNKTTTTTNVILIFISIFVVSRGVNQLYGISKNMFPPTHDRTTLLEEVFTIGKTVAVFVLIVLIILVLTFFPFVIQSINSSHHPIVDDIILVCIFFVILFLLYKIVPDAKVNSIDISIGAFAASLLLLIVLKLLEFYFGLADYNSVYGPLATVVVIMISFSIVAEVIYLGMYVMFEKHMLRLVLEMQKQLNISNERRK